MKTLYTSSNFNNCLEFLKQNCDEDEGNFDIEGIEDNGVQVTRWAVREYSFEEIYFMNGGTY